MSNLFFAMLAGHLVADFWLQPSKWILHKKEKGWKSGKLILHSLLSALLPVAFTLQITLWWFGPIIFVAHYLIDVVKTYFKESILVFVTDQLLHIGVLWLLTTYLTDILITENSYQFWVFAAGFVLVTNPLGIVTGMFLKSVTKTSNSSAKLDASAWIGIMERMLILIFVTTGQFEAIGFLVAAKSVFRFSETQKDGNKKAEYFLLGTLVSFMLAIVVGFGIQYFI